MRLADLRDYFAIRAHLAHPWGFLGLRHRGLERPHGDIELRDGGTVRIRTAPGDRHTFHRIFARDEYRLNAFGPGALDTVIDIGAHVGFFAVRVAPLAARVLCYEPVLSNFELLLWNVAGFPHLRAHRLAVAGRRGRVRLFLSERPSSHSMFPREATQRRAGIEVPCVTLADILEENAVEHCDLLKLDCEGAEYEILFSLPDGLWSRIARVVLEYHLVPDGEAGWSGEGLAERLARRGYEVRLEPSKRHPGKGHLFAERRSA